MLVTEGSLTELRRLGDFEDRFREGEEGILELKLRWTPPFTGKFLGGIDSSLKAAGVSLTRESEEIDGNRIRIYFRKAFPPLAVAAVVLAGALIVLLVWFKLFKGNTTTAILIFVLAAALLAAGFFLVVRPRIGGFLPKPGG